MAKKKIKLFVTRETLHDLIMCVAEVAGDLEKQLATGIAPPDGRKVARRMLRLDRVQDALQRRADEVRRG